MGYSEPSQAPPTLRPRRLSCRLELCLRVSGNVTSSCAGYQAAFTDSDGRLTETPESVAWARSVAKALPSTTCTPARDVREGPEDVSCDGALASQVASVLARANGTGRRPYARTDERQPSSKQHIESRRATAIVAQPPIRENRGVPCAASTDGNARRDCLRRCLRDSAAAPTTRVTHERDVPSLPVKQPGKGVAACVFPQHASRRPHTPFLRKRTFSLLFRSLCFRRNIGQ